MLSAGYKANGYVGWFDASLLLTTDLFEVNRSRIIVLGIESQTAHHLEKGLDVARDRLVVLDVEGAMDIFKGVGAVDDGIDAEESGRNT
ncbi:hypothetical protein E2542_SST20783 [Spatholobus suberectus]|nr:hypothetical protein E2542_SST20783 [Spatholobus suberectus]